MEKSVQQLCFTTIPVLLVALTLVTVCLPSSGAAAATPRSLPGKDGKECTTNCENAHEKSSTANVLHRWTMPLVTLGDKQYYLGIFFKANWYKAYQFCRYHGLHLVSIESQEENNRMEEFVKTQGLFSEHFWTSGTDQAEEGTFFWMGTGRPIGFTNWNAGEPNNFRYENGEEEHCLELWNRDGKGLKWNDSPCSFETYFICEKQD